jgi:Cytochrome c554 and c-prime
MLSIMLLTTSCVTVSGRDQQQALTLIYSGNLDGELEPCGCTEEGDLGGIKRRVNMVDQMRQEDPNLFLVSAGGLLISDTPQDRLTSEYILKGLAMVDYDAVGVQWRDLAFGKDFLSQYKLPFVASNFNDGSFLPNRIIRHGQHTLAYFQWLDPATDPQQQMQGKHSTVNNDIAGLKQDIAIAKRQGATTVLASTLTLQDARSQLPLDQVDILIIRANYEEYGEPQFTGRMLILQPGSRGMRLGRLDLTTQGNGSISEWRHKVIPLPKDVGDASRMAGWYEDYNTEVKQQYEKSVALRKALETGESPYAGEQACKDCHQEEYSVWSKSRHAHAFYTLQDVKKSFDPNCIICHTVGFDKPGGFIDPDTTPSLMHVQCESCHGAARKHVESGGIKPVTNADWPSIRMCEQCHTQPHSPSFNFEKYWPKIAHGTPPLTE